jgi:hypothetical protein
VADLGLDLSGVDDLSPQMTEVSGRLGLIQSIARRLQTPNGGLFYDPDYGYDVRRFLSAVVVNSGELASSVEAEALKDERVAQATATVVFSASSSSLLIKLEIADSGGPFAFVLAVSAVTVELLTQG